MEELARAKEGMEQNLGNEISVIFQTVKDVEVRSEPEYEMAGDMLKKIKAMQKRVKDYWEPVVKQAYDQHKALKAKENEMMSPLNDAEKHLKTACGKFVQEQERIAREEEARRRKAAQEEMERKLDEAAIAEAVGERLKAELAMAQAEILDQIAQYQAVNVSKPRVEGLKATKTWKIKVVDPAKVPVEFGGVVIRPVDESTVARLVRDAKGQIAIPGIEIVEETRMSVSA